MFRIYLYIVVVLHAKSYFSDKGTLFYTFLHIHTVYLNMARIVHLQEFTADEANLSLMLLNKPRIHSICRSWKRCNKKGQNGATQNIYRDEADCGQQISKVKERTIPNKKLREILILHKFNFDGVIELVQTRF